MLESTYRRIKKEWKIAFGATFIIGLLTHLYKFTNYLLNHDSLYNYYSDQNVLGSGRWFLSIACGISSYFDLPWINGLLSIFYIALTTVIIVDLFQIENPWLISLIGGISVTFPSITETLFFGFTADGYMLSMLLAALAVRCSVFEHTKVKWILASIVLLCLSCGIYQAYVSFALLLTIFYFIYEVVENRRSNKDIVLFILKQAVIFLVSLILYYIIWKICMRVQGVTANSYQGIDEVSNLSGVQFSFMWLIKGFINSCKSILFFFFEWNVFEHGITLYAILNLLFLLSFAVGAVITTIQSKLYNRKMQFIFVILALFVCIPGACIWTFVSEDVGYRPMMLHCLCIIYIFTAIIYYRWTKNSLRSAFVILMTIIVFNNAIIANISYNYMTQSYQRSYAMGLEIMMELHNFDDENDFTQIAIVGSRQSEVQLGGEGNSANIHIMSSLLESDLLYDETHARLFLENTFQHEYEFASSQTCKTLEGLPEVQNLEPWPSKESFHIIGDTLIIKIGDITSTP